MYGDQEETKWIANYARDKRYAEAVLRRLCLGAEILGVEFAGYPDTVSIVIGDNLFRLGANAKTDDQYLLYQSQRPQGWGRLVIEGRWSILSSLPVSSAASEQAIVESLSAVATDEQLHQLVTLRENRIVMVRLGAQAAHLFIGFESGQVLFIRGDDQYESWQFVLSVQHVQRTEAEFWMLVDMPDGDIAIWAPDTFDPDFDAEVWMH